MDIRLQGKKGTQAEHGTTTRYRHGCRCEKCSDARRSYQNNNYERFADRIRFSKLMSKYGITREQYEALFVEQEGVCAICFKPCPSGRYLSVDHDHQTKKVRGLLCLGCNTNLGWYEHNTQTIRNYLEGHNIGTK